MPDRPELRTKHNGDWLWLNNEVVRSHLPHLGHYGLAVYCVLAMHANNKTQKTFMQQRTIAQLVGCKLTAVKYALDALVTSGLLEIDSGKANGHANGYKLVEVVAHAPTPEAEGSRPDDYPVGAEAARGSRVDGDILTRLYQPDSGNQTTAAPVNGAKGSWKPILDAIDVEYRQANPGQEPPWTDLAFVRLKREMARLPQIPIERWVQCVHNRFGSDNIVVGDLPETFIPYLVRYLSGPLDRYNRPKVVSYEQVVGPRTQRNRAAVAQVLGEIHEAFRQRREAGETDQGGGGNGGDHGHRTIA